MKTKRILYFCSAYPYPIDDGIKKINVNLINEFINQKCEVTLVVPKSNKNDEFKKVNIIEYKKKRNIFSILKDLFLLQPLYFSLYFDKDLLNKIDKSAYDLIFYDFYPLTQYSSNLKSELFMMPDSMKELAFSNFKNEKNFIKKIYSLLNYFLSYFYNLRIKKLKKLYVSNEDIKIDKIENSHFFKIPADNINFEKYQNNNFNMNEILFRGVMSFEPNITAVKSFNNEIFLDLIKKYPQIKFKVVGKDVSNELKNELNNCEFVGFVPDVFEEMSKSGIHIVPMNSGTGVKTKMLDSIALKRIVFATAKSINGIFENIQEARENGILVYTNKEEFFEYFDKLLNNEINYNENTQKAFDFLAQNSYAKKIEELINLA